MGINHSFVSGHMLNDGDDAGTMTDDAPENKEMGENQILKMMTTQLPHSDSFLYRVLMSFGRKFIRNNDVKRHEAYVHGMPKHCTQNALKFASDNEHAFIWCGFFITPKMPNYPIWHCWNMISDDAIIDITRDIGEADVYFGVPIPLQMAHEIWNSAKHGNELLDSWRSAVAETSLNDVLTWEHSILGAQCINDQNQIRNALQRNLQPRYPYNYLDIDSNGITATLRWSALSRADGRVPDIDLIRITATPKRQMRGLWFFLVLRNIVYDLYKKGIYIEQAITSDSMAWTNDLVRRGLVSRSIDANSFLSSPLVIGAVQKDQEVRGGASKRRASTDGRETRSMKRRRGDAIAITGDTWFNDKLSEIANGTVVALGYLGLTNETLERVFENGDIIYSNHQTKDLFKKVYKRQREEGITKLFEALTDSRCRVVQLFAGGDGWYFDGNEKLEIQFLYELKNALPQTKLIAVNLGERNMPVDYWTPFLKAVENSQLGHLWINEQGKGSCPPAVRGSKAKRKQGVITSNPTGLQLALMRNRLKKGYKDVRSDAVLVDVLNGGLKCWRDYKVVNDPQRRKME